MFSWNNIFWDLWRTTNHSSWALFHFKGDCQSDLQAHFPRNVSDFYFCVNVCFLAIDGNRKSYNFFWLIFNDWLCKRWWLDLEFVMFHCFQFIQIQITLSPYIIYICMNLKSKSPNHEVRISSIDSLELVYDDEERSWYLD